MTLARVMVAPNGAYKTTRDHPAIPVTIAQTIATAQACYAVGAGALHAHIRRPDQRHWLDVGAYQELLQGMQEAVPQMDVQITTEAGGIYDAAFQRKLIADLQAPFISLSYAEMLRDTDDSDVTAFYRELLQSTMRVQHIFYSQHELADFLFRILPLEPDWECHYALFVLGRYSHNQQSRISDLNPYLKQLQQTPAAQSMQWSVCAFGDSQIDCLLAAQRLGGCMRIGFENALVGIDGKRVDSNQQQLAQLIALLN